MSHWQSPRYSFLIFLISTYNSIYVKRAIVFKIGHFLFYQYILQNISLLYESLYKKSLLQRRLIQRKSIKTDKIRTYLSIVQVKTQLLSS